MPLCVIGISCNPIIPVFQRKWKRDLSFFDMTFVTFQKVVANFRRIWYNVPVRGECDEPIT